MADSSNPTFSVVLFTAPPAGMAAEAGGAFVKVDGRESILRSVELFLNRDNVAQVQVVFLPESAEEGRKKYGGHLGLFGVKILTAGPRWIDQVVAAAEKISPDVSHVIVHDAARPAVPYSDIDALMEESAKAPAVALAAPIRAALVEVDEGGNALAIRSPKEFMQLLTPMVFSAAAFQEMAKKKSEPHASSLRLLKGSPLNVRVGSSADDRFVKSMLQLLPKPKIKGPSNPFEEAQW